MTNSEMVCAFSVICVADALLALAVIRTWRKNTIPFQVDNDKFRSPKTEKQPEEGEIQAGRIWTELTHQIIRDRNTINRKAARTAQIRLVEAGIADAEYGAEGGDAVEDGKNGWRHLNR